MKLKVNVMKSLTTMFFSALTITGVSATNALQGAPNQTAQPVTFPAEISLFIPPEPVAPPPPQEMLQALPDEMLQLLRSGHQPETDAAPAQAFPQKGLQMPMLNYGGYQLQTGAAPAQAFPRKGLQMPVLNYGGYQLQTGAAPAQAFPQKGLQMPVLNYGGYQLQTHAARPPKPTKKIVPGPAKKFLSKPIKRLDPKELLTIPQEMINARTLSPEEAKKDCYKSYFKKRNEWYEGECEKIDKKADEKKITICKMLAQNINNARDNGSLKEIFAYLDTKYNMRNINIPVGCSKSTDYAFIESFLYYNPDAFDDPVLRPIVQNVNLRKDYDKFQRQEEVARYEFIYSQHQESNFARKISSIKVDRSSLLAYIQRTYNADGAVKVPVRAASRGVSARFVYLLEIFGSHWEALKDKVIQEAFNEPVLLEDLSLAD